MTANRRSPGKPKSNGVAAKMPKPKQHEDVKSHASEKGDFRHAKGGVPEEQPAKKPSR